jgi:acetolactate synthase-1/2/3 large subunit
MILKEAFYIAREGRPGVVLIRHLQGCAERHWPVPLRHGRSTCPGSSLGQKSKKTCLRPQPRLINGSRAAVDSGRSRHQAGRRQQELLELVEKAEMPVVTTLLGTGDIPEIIR